jgi:hypothetical protein
LSIGGQDFTINLDVPEVASSNAHRKLEADAPKQSGRNLESAHDVKSAFTPFYAPRLRSLSLDDDSSLFISEANEGGEARMSRISLSVPASQSRRDVNDPAPAVATMGNFVRASKGFISKVSVGSLDDVSIRGLMTFGDAFR